MKSTIIIKGTSCKACKTLIEDVSSDIPGIESCSVNFSTGITEVEYKENSDLEKLKQAIEGLGQYCVAK